MRAVIIVVVAVVGFAAAWWFAGRSAPAPEPVTADPSPAAEATAEPQGPAYDVQITSDPDPPAPAGTTFIIDVRRDGAPVSGAEVRLAADMTDMAHEGVGGQAEEVEPGRYEIGLSFPMRGGWSGRLTVTEPGQEPFSMPVSFEVG